MNKCFILVVTVLLAVVIITFNGDREEIGLEISEVCYEDSCFEVEIADDNQERAKGLMFRESLCDDCGMLFVYGDEGRYPFWMKDTLIPLDIIWLDSDLRVVSIANAVPCTEDPCENYDPGVDALYILEINSGRSLEMGLKAGNSLEFVFTPKDQ